ncbi:alpha/beta hydrolase [Saccharopolyspora rhizosphaerae]|uniref:Alpha/beta hydrolase n=1 Tax=Saccharopolyspora rhizosphaerae TaxID=2492662 RepID=A0A426JLM3_9PSEU|nr:alpha/beta hydrolase [Saccharopolyspora rhizosphaerae]RRO14122.1 alpha/beta hydrolase [Saccharopolyspora rhizosphaerae]
MPMIEREGVKLWYDHVPGPRPVLFLHGFASDSERTWERTGWLRAVADRGHVVTDLRGHGQSERAATGFSPDELARDALAVLDAAQVPEVDAVTYSMGGLVGWELARLAPGRVRALALGGIGGGAVRREAMLEVQQALSAEDRTPCVEGMTGHRLTGAPPAPALFAAGEEDQIAADAAAFAEEIGAVHVSLGRRNHVNAVSSRAFKTAALDFLDRTEERAP